MDARSILFGASLVAGLLAGGCHTLAITDLQCSSDADCPTNNICGDAKKCVVGSRPSCDCTGHVCGTVCGNVCAVCPDDGTCSTDGKSCTASPLIGSACTADLDCGNGRICLGSTDGIQAPHGYCSKACGGSVVCPTGSSCGLSVKGDSVCLATCSGGASAACRTTDGYACNGAGICPACVGNCSAKTCGDDGCGGSCGVPATSMTPACSLASQICTSGQCVVGFIPDTGGLPTADYNGLWDAVAIDRSGEALIVGGREVIQYGGTAPVTCQTESRGVNKVEIYDATQHGILTRLAPMPSPIARPHAALYNGQIFVAGGINDADTPCTADSIDSHFYIFKGNANWATDTAAPIPDPSMGGGLALVGNSLYLVVGAVCPGATCSAIADYRPSALMHVYDPTADKWDTPSTPPSRPTARSFVGVVSDGIRLYVIGGSDGQNALGTVEIFDPSTGWTTTQPLPVPTVDPKVAIASGRVFVFGGRIGLLGAAAVVPLVQTIDLKTHATQLLGETYEQLTGQAPVYLPEVSRFLLLGAQLFTTSTAAPLPAADNDVVVFSIPP